MMENQNPNWRQKVLTAVDDPAEGGHGRRRGGGEGPNCNGYKGGDEGEEEGDDEREQKGETAIRQIMEGARFVGASGLGRIHGKGQSNYEKSMAESDSSLQLPSTGRDFRCSELEIERGGFGRFFLD